MESRASNNESFLNDRTFDNAFRSRSRRALEAEERPMTSTGRNNWANIDWESENESTGNSHGVLEGHESVHPLASFNIPFSVSENALFSMIINASTVEETKQGLPNEMIEKVRSMKMGNSGQDCSVCYNGFKKGERIRKLPCKHIFHDSCIVPWLGTNITCPNCRFNLLEFFSENSDGECR